MTVYLTELIGTFFLVLTIGLTAISGASLAPIAIGATLMVMVFMGGHVSGAHYNPAVSLAVFLRGKLALKEMVYYLIFQIIGALLAGLAVCLIVGRTFAPAPAADASMTGVLLVELLFTFALGLVVLNVTASTATEGNSFYGLAIGFTIAAGATAGGPISGGVFNPAVGIGPILVDAVWGDGSLSNLWIYLVAPSIGAALASFVFGLQDKK